MPAGIISGFTLTNGSTMFNGSWLDKDCSGGAVFGTESTMITNCTLAGNIAEAHGGGSFGGILYNCILRGNSADEGGGAYSNTLNNCVLTANHGYDGGGAVKNN